MYESASPLGAHMALQMHMTALLFTIYDFSRQKKNPSHFEDELVFVFLWFVCVANRHIGHAK